MALSDLRLGGRSIRRLDPGGREGSGGRITGAALGGCDVRALMVERRRFRKLAVGADGAQPRRRAGRCPRQWRPHHREAVDDVGAIGLRTVGRDHDHLLDVRSDTNEEVSCVGRRRFDHRVIACGHRRDDRRLREIDPVEPARSDPRRAPVTHRVRHPHEQRTISKTLVGRSRRRPPLDPEHRCVRLFAQPGDEHGAVGKGATVDLRRPDEVLIGPVDAGRLDCGRRRNVRIRRVGVRCGDRRHGSRGRRFVERGLQL